MRWHVGAGAHGQGLRAGKEARRPTYMPSCHCAAQAWAASLHFCLPLTRLYYTYHIVFLKNSIAIRDVYLRDCCRTLPASHALTATVVSSTLPDLGDSEITLWCGRQWPSATHRGRPDCRRTAGPDTPRSAAGILGPAPSLCDDTQQRSGSSGRDRAASSDPPRAGTGSVALRRR